MARLSSPIQNIQAKYTVVVVGSGYGGSISASRLARAGQSVCLLERGREIETGQFPETQEAALPELQFDAPLGHVGSPTGMFDFRINPQVSVLVGCGLGGTSLINANVALHPDPRVFQDGRWPKALANDTEVLEVGYALAEKMLRPNPYPADWPVLPKMQAQAQSAQAMGMPLMRPPINVTFKDGPSPSGVAQKACILCGNCVSGCNHLAKNTVLMNYLPDAKHHGAEIYCGARVRWVERDAGGWIVHYQVIEDGQTVTGKGAAGPTQFVRAEVVILAAGTLGSTEILLRSREKGLPLSDALGRDFSGNGDMLGFAYNAVPDVNGIGVAGDQRPEPPVGPTITTAIDARGHDSVEQDVLLEEGAIPSALTSFVTDGLFAVAGLTALAGTISGTPLGTISGTPSGAPSGTPSGMIAGNGSGPRPDRTLAGAAHATQLYLAMSLDDDRGQLLLQDDRLRVVWPDAGREPDLREGSDEMKQAAAAIGGTYLMDPLWSDLAGRRLLTVHPLGGCTLGDDASMGVVDDCCRVFDGKGGGASTSVHEGLFVCDGSIIPSPLGVNPLFTISALTERACHHLAAARGWTIDYTLPSAVPITPPPPMAGKVGIRFTETMKGFWKSGVTDDYTRGAAEGKAAGSSFEFSLDIESSDVDDMVKSPAHEARMLGTAQAPALSPLPLTVTDGVFNLFTADPAQPGYRFMRYRMRLTDEAGRAFWFDGEKHIGNDSPLEAWHDSTTLYITIHDGPDAGAPVLGKGIIQIGVVDVAKLVEGIHATNAHGLFQRAGAVLKFMRYFLGAEIKTYLKLLK